MHNFIHQFLFTRSLFFVLRSNICRPSSYFIIIITSFNIIVGILFFFLITIIIRYAIVYPPTEEEEEQVFEVRTTSGYIFVAESVEACVSRISMIHVHQNPQIIFILTSGTKKDVEFILKTAWHDFQIFDTIVLHRPRVWVTPEKVNRHIFIRRIVLQCLIFSSQRNLHHKKP